MSNPVRGQVRCYWKKCAFLATRMAYKLTTLQACWYMPTANYTPPPQKL